MAGLFAKKPLERLMAESQEVGEHCLKRSLGPVNLVMLGIGAIIGAGLFVRTAAAIADRAGPSVVLAFIVAGMGCAFAGLCYAEFASMIPVAGSAYTYSYATMGEFVAWIIGWDLILEYAVGAATVAIAWSEYANRVLDWFGMRIPYQWAHSPFERDINTGVHGIMNMPAVFILLLLTLLLIRGTKESAFVNGIIVILKVSIVLLVIGIGWHFVNPANHTPLIPASTTYVTPQGISHAYGGILGILGAAGVVFFAYIGFDAVSTAAQEARNPKRDMPIGILGSLVICTILYVLFSYVLSGVATVQDFRSHGREASVAFAITKYMTGYEWLSKSVTVAILAGFSSVILVMLLGQSRVFYSMSRDGLVPKTFSDVHPKFKTPYKSNILFFLFTGAFDTWHSVATSEEVEMPPHGSVELADVDLATIPFHFSFQQLANLFGAVNDTSVARLVSEFQKRVLTCDRPNEATPSDTQILRSLNLSLPAIATAEHNFKKIDTEKLAWRARRNLRFAATSPARGFEATLPGVNSSAMG